MSDTTTCSYCGCTLTMGRYEFTGHTDELCKALTLDRIRFTERALENAKNDLAILRDMMGRHVCASEPAPPDGAEVREAAEALAAFDSSMMAPVLVRGVKALNCVDALRVLLSALGSNAKRDGR